MATTICPVCNQATNTTFCNHCGFEIHILPTTVSAEVKAYEEKRIAKYKENLTKLKEEQEAHESTKRELEKMRAEKTTAASSEPSTTVELIPFPAELVIADKCPVCESKMTEEQTYCEHCGWTRIIYPQVVPPAIVRMEEERLSKMKEAYQKRLDKERQQTADTKSLNEEIRRQKQLVADAQNKNKELTESNEKLFDELFATKGELSIVKGKLDIANGKLDAANKKIADVESERDVANEKLLKETTEHTKTKGLLEAEQKAHAATRKELEELRAKAKNNPPVQPTPPVKPNTPTKPKGKKRGDAIFNLNGKTIRVPLYEGENELSAPQGMNCGVSGNLFQVKVDATGTRIYDTCGKTRRANGLEIGPKGKEIYSGDVFAIGSMKVAFEMEEIDLDNLLI